MTRRPIPRLARLLAVTLGASALTVLLPVLHVQAQGPVHIRAGEVVTSVEHSRIVALPFAASHVAVHWTNEPDARLTIAFGSSPRTLGPETAIERDEVSELDGDQTFGGVLDAAGSRFVRITSDRPIGRLTVVAIDSGSQGSILDAVTGALGGGTTADAAVTAPTIITRAGWGADESLRFDASGHQKWAPSFNPLQVMIIHHTAGLNNDPNPAATIRAIYYYDAITRGWGDIGYNFLVDAQGRIYEGRYSRAYATGELHTGEDLAGNVVRGAHALDFNDGSMGVALLGTFTSVLPTSAAISALKHLLAWKAERHGLNPKGTTTYVNAVTGLSKSMYVISGHRDVNPTACPGQAFYDTFPTLRSTVANLIASTTGPAVDHTAPAVLSLAPMVPTPTGSLSMPFGLTFSEPVTGLTAADFGITGSSPGWSVASITGKASTYSVTLTNAAPTAGTVDLTLAAGSVTDLAGNVGPATPKTSSGAYAVDAVAPGVEIFATPSRTATTATSFDFSVTFSEPVTGFTKADIALGGTSEAATPWTIEPLYGAGASYDFTIDRSSPADGTLTITIPAGAAADLAGNASLVSNTVSKVVDRTAPWTSAPITGLRAGVSLSSSEPVRLTWTSGDATSGIATYDVARSVNGGAFSVLVTGLTSPRVATTLVPGWTYRFEVRAHDRAGNVSAWHAGPTLWPRLIQQSSSSIAYHGTWYTASSSAYSGGSERYTTAAGAWLGYTFTGRSIGFVTTRAPSRGAVKVYLDGVYAGTVDLYATSTQYRFVAFAHTWGSSATHTIKLVAVGTTGRPRVDLDAFEVVH